MPSTDIRAARQALGLSLKGLADALGVADRQTVRRYEDGSREPSGLFVTALGMLCQLRGLSPKDFGLPETP